MAGAKLRPPLIVLSLDFPYSLVPMSGTTALPLTLHGLAGWQLRVGVGAGVSSTPCLNAQTASVWTPLLLNTLMRWCKLGGKYHNSVQISVHVRSLICRRLPPTLLVLHPAVGCLSHPGLRPGSERASLQLERWRFAKTLAEKESSCSCCSCCSCVLKRALRFWSFFCLESLRLTHQWVRCLTSFFLPLSLSLKVLHKPGKHLHYFKSFKGSSGFIRVEAIG